MHGGCSAAVVLTFLSGAGCSSAEPHAARWLLRFADAPTEGLATYVEARIVEGGCGAGPVVYVADVAAEMSPGRLAAGRYGFEAVANNAACERIAYGCVDNDLPLPDGSSIEVLLATLSAVPQCSGQRCTNGRCENLLDGGMDAAPDARLEGGDSGDVPDDLSSEPPIDIESEPPIDSNDETPPPDVTSDVIVPNCPSRCSSSVGPSGHTYCLCLGDVTWTSASLECLTAGFRLARIDDTTENNWVRTFATNGGATAEIWIGANDQMIEGDWQWEDGEVFWRGDETGGPVGGLYSNWNGAQPGGSEIGEDFCRIIVGGTWSDTTSPSSRHSFVCEGY